MSSPKITTAVCVMWFFGALFASDLRAVWLDVPFEKQEKNGCGAASIAMVMHYWQKQQGKPETTSAESARIFRALRTDATHGIFAADMERYFRQNGYSAFAFAGDWSDLQHHLEQGRPLITALKTESDFHYVVVTGLDPNQKLVLLNDPAQRKLLKEEYSRFDQEWNAAGRWTLLALPSD